MNTSEVKTKGDLKKLLQSRPELKHVHAAVVDHTGQMRGKLYSIEKFAKALDDGLALTRNFASVDVGDVMYPVEGLIGGDPSFPDAKLSIVPESIREIPWEPESRNLFALLEYTDDELFPASALCSRALLKDQIEKAEGMGFKVYSACELEFRLFEETLEEAVEKKFKNLTYCPSDSHYLSMVRYHNDNDFFNGFLDAMEAMDIDIESFHSELGPGFHEAVLRYQEGMKAADNAAIYKTFAKAYIQRQGRLGTFMARCDQDGDGSSAHIHISLKSCDGEPVFYDDEQDANISETMLYFLGGLQKVLPEILLMLAPTVNSMRRFQPGLFSPMSSSWAVDNRTTGLRVIPGGPHSLRIESRLAGADVNPYLCLAATVAAGLWGIENSVVPTDPIDGCLWDQIGDVPNWQILPTSFGESVARMKNSELAKEIFGSEFVRIFSSVREYENEDFQKELKEAGVTDERVTDWELIRFLEKI